MTNDVNSIFKNIAKQRGYSTRVDTDVYKTELTRCGSLGGTINHYIHLIKCDGSSIIVYDSKIGKEEVIKT